MLLTSEQEKCFFEVFQRLCFYLEFFPLFSSPSCLTGWEAQEGFSRGPLFFSWGIKEVGSEALCSQRAFYFLPQRFQVFSGGAAVPRSKKKMDFNSPWNQICFGQYNSSVWSAGVESTPILFQTIFLPFIKVGKMRSSLSWPCYSHGSLAAFALTWDFVKTKSGGGGTHQKKIDWNRPEAPLKAKRKPSSSSSLPSTRSPHATQ